MFSRSIRGLARIVTKHVVGRGGFRIENIAATMATLLHNNKATELSSYEDAVRQLHSLQSNAESIIKARENREKNRASAIPKMVKFIERSGLTMEDVDKLSVVHVSGTKGKGSTCAYLERIFHHHGYKTGLFSSPHLVEVRERIRINGRPVGREEFSMHFWRVYNRLKETETEAPPEEGGGMPAYFAFLTVLSLHVFLSEGVDVAVMEVGIGGQYDSTNFFRKPVVCGVTSLGLDHTAMLGNTIEEIAWNKAGIFKMNCPAVTASQCTEALQVLLSRAKERQSPLYLSQTMSPEDLSRLDVKFGIAGDKTSENASLAVNLFRIWKKAKLPDESSAISVASDPEKLSAVSDIPVLSIKELEDIEKKGLGECVWPGRAQTIKKENVTYYLDGAHTKESIQLCAHWFQEVADKEKEEFKGKVARVLLFNITGDRDPKTLLSFLKGANFDAAVFSTNILSTVESKNKADQLNKTVTKSSMLHKAEINKLSWDSLMQQAATDLHGNGSLTGQADSGTMDSSKQVNGGFLHKHTDSSTSINDFLTSKKSRFEGMPESEAHIVHETSSLPPHTESSIHSTTQIVSSNRAFSSSTSTSTSPLVDQNGNKPCPSKQSHSTSHEANGDNTEKIINSNIESCSHVFPCIMDALAWATQGRDPEINSPETGSNLPAVPQHLRVADRVQILVTGSLHLVGGVLGVIDSSMNE